MVIRITITMTMSHINSIPFYSLTQLPLFYHTHTHTHTHFVAKWERRMIPARKFNFDTAVGAIGSNERKWNCDDVALMFERPSEADRDTVDAFMEFFEPPYGKLILSIGTMKTLAMIYLFFVLNLFINLSNFTFFSR